MLNTVSFSVSTKALHYWEARLKQFGVDYQPPEKRLDDSFIYFEDTDGLGLELVFNENDERAGFSYGHIPHENSIKGFFHAEIRLENVERTAAALTQLLDHQLIAEDGACMRFAAADKPGAYIDLVHTPGARKGLGGGGTVHHIAFAVDGREEQELVRQRALEAGLAPTEIIDRQYFNSVYFREPGGVLFEIATAGPGFTVDEEVERLGESLKLPAQYEQYREQIERAVRPVQFRPDNYN